MYTVFWSLEKPKHGWNGKPTTCTEVMLKAGGCLTFILLTWRIWWAPNNASRWQVGFNSALKWLRYWQNSSVQWRVFLNAAVNHQGP